MPEGITLNQAAISGSNDAAGRQLSQTDPEGRTTSWVFDAAGREVVTDHSSPDVLITEHEPRFDRCGRLIGRARGNQSLAWAYDADGNRSSFTDAHGSTTSYVRDGGGRVTGMSNSLLGRAEFGYDAAGHLSRAVIPDLVQDRVYRDGLLTEHTNTTPGSGEAAMAITLIAHDSHGRIAAITKDGRVTRYGHDDAGQLTTATTTSASASDNTAGQDTAVGAGVLGCSNGSMTLPGGWSANPPQRCARLWLHGSGGARKPPSS
ncbi:hypothetical protein MB46_06625 [Arthrobacter alpinus]|nr:hypothetical protein MB46_06625 [Arthrobacter alpinus]